MESAFPLLNFNANEILAFALVFLRMSAFTVTWPVFSVFNVPGYLKILFAVTVSMVVFPIIDRSGLGGAGFTQDIGWLAGKEVLTGLCLGFMTRLFFFAISVGGNLIATSSGLANGQLFNPALGATTTTVEQFYSSLATLLFLSLNGHHYFLTAIVQSFEFIPLVIPAVTGGTDVASPFSHMVGHFSESGMILQTVVVAGIKMSAPILVTIFVLNVVMGVISRAVPQVNVLVTSMSVNFMAALVVMIIAIPTLILELDHQLLDFVGQLFKFMRSN